MKKFFYGLLRTVAWLFVIAAPVLIFMFIYTGISQIRYWPLVIGIGMLWLLLRVHRWLDLM